ncbi:DUF1972 domain-containing protein [Providencia huaxiensis]|uniref:DUF1972 domain-containing protein n=1 Tax=Providencia TaxID=586 RepID=UPI00255281E6|nr:DUF1972 domain-containing protein [Providencia rettgeri]
MKTKVTVIGTVGIPANYGGFETLVENLTKLSSSNIEYTIICSSKENKIKLTTHNNANLLYLPLKANGIQSIPYDILSMILTARKSDILLVLGVSGCIFLPFLKIFSNVKIITNIDGLEWKRNKWNYLAKRFLKLSEAIAVKYSDTIIADNQAIADYVTQNYNKKAAVIAYGGDHAILASKNVPNQFKDYYLTVCRIEPENNLHVILDSFQENNMNLVIVGNWKTSNYGLDLYNRYNNSSNITLLHPIYDHSELYALRKNCIGYIHGHSAGGTNPSLVEIMHFSKPIYAFDCIFNRYTTDNQILYFKNSSSLTDCLKKEKNENFFSNEKCILIKKIADERYSWEQIKNSYEELYNEK